MDLPIKNNEPEYTNIINDVYTLQDFNFDKNGIYSFVTESDTEINYFIVEVKENDLILSGTGKGESDYMNIDHISKKRYNGELIRITTLSGKKIELTKEAKDIFLF